MNTRTQDLLHIRPSLSAAFINEHMSHDERFQNITLRPLLVLQNDLIIEVFKNYISKHKIVFSELSLPKQMNYIENAVHRDMKFRNSIKGMIVGQFTIEEYRLYILNSSALNKRMMNLVRERLISQLQLFKPNVANVIMNIKSEVLQACYDYANKRIVNYRNEIDTIKESIESNDKSGEDDDSGNGKLFNDLEKNSQYLIDAQKMLESLKTISPKLVSQTIGLGSLIKTSSNNFYIAISAGKITLDNFTVYAISLNSPIGILLQNKSEGDVVTFNGNSFTVTEII